MTQEEFQEELDSVKTNTFRSNYRLLSKEAKKFAMHENLKKAMSLTEENLMPDNFEDTLEELFSLEDVSIARNTCDYHFDKKTGDYIGEYPTQTHRGLSPESIVKSVKDFLDKGFAVYIYQYYMTIWDVVVDGLTVPMKFYWWRMIVRKDEQKID